MPGRWLGRKHNGGKQRRQQWRSRRTMRSRVTKRRANSTVAEYLTGCTEALLASDRQGRPAGLAYACSRIRGFQRNPPQDMMMQHEHHQQMELHHC